MNPYDSVGTARISGAIYDRTCRIAMGYQSPDAEDAIAVLRAPTVPDEWRAKVVELIRSTRNHPDVRVGSSVRGVIDMIKLAGTLAEGRGVPVDDWHLGLDAATVALSGRVRLHESSTRTPEEVVRELYVGVFGQPPKDDDDSGEA